MEKCSKKCDCCKSGMNKGYVDNDKYYCSDRCLIWGNSEDKIELNQVGLYDMNDWERDHTENPDACYYTEWEEIDEEQFYDVVGNEYTTCHKCNTITTANDLCDNCLTSL